MQLQHCIAQVLAHIFMVAILGSVQFSGRMGLAGVDSLAGILMLCFYLVCGRLKGNQWGRQVCQFPREKSWYHSVLLQRKTETWSLGYGRGKSDHTEAFDAVWLLLGSLRVGLFLRLGSGNQSLGLGDMGWNSDGLNVNFSSEVGGYDNGIRIEALESDEGGAVSNEGGQNTETVIETSGWNMGSGPSE